MYVMEVAGELTTTFLISFNTLIKRHSLQLQENWKLLKREIYLLKQLIHKNQKRKWFSFPTSFIQHCRTLYAFETTYSLSILYATLGKN